MLTKIDRSIWRRYGIGSIFKPLTPLSLKDTMSIIIKIRGDINEK